MSERVRELWAECIKLQPNLCAAPSPFEDATPCVMYPAHPGDHEGLRDEFIYRTWSRTPVTRNADRSDAGSDQPAGGEG